MHYTTTTGQYPPPVTRIVETGDGYLLHRDGFNPYPVTVEDYHGNNAIPSDLEAIADYRAEKTWERLYRTHIGPFELDDNERWIPELDGWRGQPRRIRTTRQATSRCVHPRRRSPPDLRRRAELALRVARLRQVVDRLGRLRARSCGQVGGLPMSITKPTSRQWANGPRRSDCGN